MKIWWTHSFDLQMKFASIIFCMLLSAVIVPFGSVYYFVLSTIATLLLWFYFFRTLSTILYCRFTLGMNINWRQAKSLDAALSPIHIFFYENKWPSLIEVKELSSEVKYEQALMICHNWEENVQQKKLQWDKDHRTSRNSWKLSTWVLMILLCGYIIYCMFAAWMNIFPADYITIITQKILGEHGTYYPLLNAVVSMIPGLILFQFILKHTDKEAAEQMKKNQDKWKAMRSKR